MNFDLFTQADSFYDLNIQDASCQLYPEFYDQLQADRYFEQLYQSIDWRQEKIMMYGKQIDIPRLSAWYGDPGLSYQYSGIRTEAIQWNPILLEIKQKLEVVTNKLFNSVLVNLYRDGNDSVDWHSDDEPELGREPVIASISLGASRMFHLKNKHDKNLKQSVLLPHGSLLLMTGHTQRNWRHKISKSTRKIPARINLTYRQIITQSKSI